LFGVAALVLAACSGGGGVSSQKQAQLYNRYGECLRQSGLPGLVDPTVDNQGRVHVILPSQNSMDAYLTAATNCDALRQEITNALGGRQDLSTQVANFTRCMRANGLPDYQFPDPDTLHTAPNTPAFQSASHACGPAPVGKHGVIFSCCAVKPG